MNDEFQIYPEEIEQLESLREFEIWFNTMDSCVQFENIDSLLSYLSTIDKPDFYMYAYNFKQQYLK